MPKKEKWGVAHILATKNSTIVHITDITGSETIARYSSGMMTDKDREGGMPFPAMLAAKKAAEEALARGERLILDAVKRLSKVYFLPVERLKPFDPKLSTFTNINTYEDLREALSRLKHEGG